MSWVFDPLPPFCADLVVIDPPTTFSLRSVKGEKKSAQAQYKCMSDEEIMALPVGHLVGSNAWLFLWATGPKLDFSMACLKHWGFEFVTEIIWRKVTKNGKPAIGPGYVARTRHEPVLIGKIGSPAYRKALPSEFAGVRREHSRKPEEFYRLIDNHFAPSYMRKLDCFSRATRPGWLSFGDELTKFDTKETLQPTESAAA